VLGVFDDSSEKKRAFYGKDWLKLCRYVISLYVGFMGSALIKDEKVFEKLQNLTKPIDILKEITFQEV
jgi:hypothetical protein